MTSRATEKGTARRSAAARSAARGGDAGTVASRRARIIEILSSATIDSQQMLRDLLLHEGIAVSQGTLSRDLVAVGAVRQVLADGQARYAVRTGQAVAPLPRQDALGRVAADVLIAAEPAGNIAVLRTPPGAAHYLADSLDRSHLGEVVGTVAGDDTLMVVARSPRAARRLCEQLLELAGRGKRGGRGNPPQQAGAAR